MSILIKMEMPICRTCPCCEEKLYGNLCRITNEIVFFSFDRGDKCPLIEVPPHGRLIDADALNKDIEQSVVFSARQQKQNAEIRGAFKVYDRIKVAPTIIEAEGEDDSI